MRKICTIKVKIKSTWRNNVRTKLFKFWKIHRRESIELLGKLLRTGISKINRFQRYLLLTSFRRNSGDAFSLFVSGNPVTTTTNFRDHWRAYPVLSQTICHHDRCSVSLALIRSDICTSYAEGFSLAIQRLQSTLDLIIEILYTQDSAGKSSFRDNVSSRIFRPTKSSDSQGKRRDLGSMHDLH